MTGRIADAGRFEAVIFDFDYTLADLSLGVIECMNYAFREMGLPIRSPEAIRAEFGVSQAATYKALTGEEGLGRFAEFERFYEKRGDQYLVDRVRLFDSTKATVE